MCYLRRGSDESVAGTMGSDSTNIAHIITRGQNIHRRLASSTHANAVCNHLLSYK